MKNTRIKHYITGPADTARTALAHLHQFAHAGGCAKDAVAELLPACVEDQYEYYDADDEDRPSASERYAVEVTIPDTHGCGYESVRISTHPTEEEADAAAQEHNTQADAKALKLVTLDIPEPLDPDLMEWHQDHEKRDGHAYKQTACASYHHPSGHTLTSRYTGHTHDIDGHRIGWNTANIQSAIDNLANWLEQWEVSYDSEDPCPLILSAGYCWEPKFTAE